MTPDPKHDSHEDYGSMSGFTRNRLRAREVQYAKALAKAPVDPTGKVVILPIYSTSKMMALAKEASND